MAGIPASQELSGSPENAQIVSLQSLLQSTLISGKPLVERQLCPRRTGFDRSRCHSWPHTPHPSKPQSPGWLRQSLLFLRHPANPRRQPLSAICPRARQRAGFCRQRRSGDGAFRHQPRPLGTRSFLLQEQSDRPWIRAPPRTPGRAGGSHSAAHQPAPSAYQLS